MSETGVFILLFFFYLAAHLGLYLAWLRRLPIFSREEGILRYHLLSAIVAGCAVFFAPPETVKSDLVLFCLSAHGIYSLSFLSVWSSSDGGFSLRIISHIDQAAAAGKALRMDDLYRLADAKKKDRIQSLVDVGLAEHREGVYRHTDKGRRMAGVILFICRLCRIQRGC